MTAEICVFPLTGRIGKIRAVAVNLIGSRSEKLAKAYRHQISAGLISHMEKNGVPQHEQGERLFEFWQAVHTEIAKRIEGAA
ncbi:hypothetical protein HLI18_33790 [Rhizobium laguerreae]|uniref:DUF6074 family protein n=1 Tax=Rhizobium TaxID=379 RepID=UPI0014784847|nr:MULTISPECIES: DUF6074 family protein [Rhizobium]MBY5624458.1 hypothetical protein [Rhizobium leguminosarum]NNG74706.1 hypothetical protein [Rhizobium laguerreae]QND39107.1 hypothetical protein HB771_17420 [Rhizobium leguminosarum bv. viciae]